MRGDRRDPWPERFCYTHPPTPTVVLPARQTASLLPCRRMRAGLRPSGSRCRDACCLLGWRLRRRPRCSVGWVPGRVRSLGAGHSPNSAIRGARKNSIVGRSGRRGVPMPKRGSRRIGATNRGAACVALRPPSSGDICRPPRPGERPQANFFSRPGATCHPKPRLPTPPISQIPQLGS